MTSNLRIVFMGTPEFAVPSLEILIENKFNIVGAITAPDKPAGRGLQLKASPVKETALKYNIPVLQPVNLKSEEFIKELAALKPDLQIVVAFRMLPEKVWSLPKEGTFNLHASLLPQYRGAAPINWAVINGEKETGVTTFFLQHEIDTGDIIFSEKEIIREEDSAGTLYDRLMQKGAGLVLKTVDAISQGKISTQPQQFNDELKSAPKIHKETCRIDWNKSSREIKNFVRGLSPYPAAWTTLNGKNHKIYAVQIIDRKIEGDPGNYKTDNNWEIIVKTGDGAVAIEDLQVEGKRRMKTEEYLRGNKL
ncbi:MAG: methionyl-tRNA formyltransferase [Cytophagaceae bacterium]|nr:methionyl-tRNA formyltransferase [Cytophagaceae bacterium]